MKIFSQIIWNNGNNGNIFIPLQTKGVRLDTLIPLYLYTPIP